VIFISIKKRGTIQGKKRVRAFLRLCLIMESSSRKPLEKDFWDVSSMKHFLTRICLLRNDSVAENAAPCILFLNFMPTK
jgi:hypothetical protein